MSSQETAQPDGPAGFKTDRDTSGRGHNILSMKPSDVVITNDLEWRSCKVPDIASEAAALKELASLVPVEPRQAVIRVLEWAVTLCGAGSAGLSLLESGPDGMEWFRWDEIVGPLGLHTGGGTPRHFSPCGLCLDAGGTILVSRPFAVFDYFNTAQKPVLEGLVVPLYDTGGTPMGTVWLVHHDVTRRFDAEDARVLEQLSAVMVLALKARQATSAPDGKFRSRVVPVASQSLQSSESRADAGSRQSDRPLSRTVRSEDVGMSLSPVVRKLGGFATLGEDDRNLLERLTADARPVPARSDLIREGEPIGGSFLVVEGMACRSKIMASGRRQITAYLLPGDSCDLDGASRRSMDHGITMLTSGRVARIARPTMVALLRDHPRIADALRMATLVDEATLREWLVNIGCRSALERIAHLFCELRVRLQLVDMATEDGFELPMTQLDIADTTGLSNVHVNRTLQELRRRGLIALSGKVLRILDPVGLRDLAEFRPDYLHARVDAA